MHTIQLHALVTVTYKEKPKLACYNLAINSLARPTCLIGSLSTSSNYLNFVHKYCVSAMYNLNLSISHYNVIACYQCIIDLHTRKFDAVCCRQNETFSCAILTGGIKTETKSRDVWLQHIFGKSYLDNYCIVNVRLFIKCIFQTAWKALQTGSTYLR